MFRDGTARLLVFQLGAERFAVPLERVEEVIDAPAVRPLPDAAASVCGIAFMQGGWVTVYNARPLLNVDRGRDGAAVLFARSSGRVALAVDDVFDAIVVAERELRPAPRSAAIGVVVGLLRRGNELIAVLDADALLDAVIAVREFEAEGETT